MAPGHAYGSSGSPVSESCLNGVKKSMGRSTLLFIALIFSAYGQDASTCNCGDGHVICLSQAQIRARVKHIEMAPDRMGNHVNISGITVIEVIVGTDGHATNARAISGNPVALARLLESVNNWRFAPLMKDGTARRVCGRLNVQFSIVENQPRVKVVEP